MSTELEPPPETAPPRDGAVTYLLNPAITMSSGKTIAQIAHAAVMAAETLDEWVAAGCPGQVIAPDRATFAAACTRDDLAATVVDAGLTEVPPGTITVLRSRTTRTGHVRDVHQPRWRRADDQRA